MNFSIIIPLYNKEKHIKRAIYSILQQTYQRFEIIVVDDGSTDSSYQEAASINDSRLRILRKKNGGVSSARNYAIQNSKYDYIGFLDADDAWKPSFLESMVSLIKKYPEAGVYATSYEFGWNNTFRRAKINVKLNDGEASYVDYFEGALIDPLITSSSVVIRKHVFDDVGLFSQELNRGEDLEMWLRIALKYRIVFLNKVLVTYYQDSDNKLTNSKRVYSKSFISRVENILIEQMRIGPPSPYFEEYMISRLMSKVRYLITVGKNKEARKLLWKYKHTRYNKKKWLINYILSFRPVCFLYQIIK